MLSKTGQGETNVQQTWLLTWTTYGSWLPGDARGWVGKAIQEPGYRHTNNTPGQPYDANDGLTCNVSANRLRHPPVMLSGLQAQVVGSSLLETSTNHGVLLIAASVMVDHVHALVTCPDIVRAQNVLKGASGSALWKDSGRTARRWWTAKGNRRLVKSPAHYQRAIHYVRTQKGVLWVYVNEDVTRGDS